MDSINRLLANNKKWAEEMISTNPEFFKNLQDIQTPEFLWIGCADNDWSVPVPSQFFFTCCLLRFYTDGFICR